MTHSKGPDSNALFPMVALLLNVNVHLKAITPLIESGCQGKGLGRVRGGGGSVALKGALIHSMVIILFSPSHCERNTIFAPLKNRLPRDTYLLHMNDKMSNAMDYSCVCASYLNANSLLSVVPWRGTVTDWGRVGNDWLRH